MVDPSLTISIDRTSLGEAPLVLSAAPGSELGITDYAEPAMLARVSYAPASRIVHGEMSLGWAWQQTVLPFSFSTFVDTEAESRALVASVLAAVTQAPTFEVTVTISDAAAETWVCDPGSLAPSGSRTRPDMQRARPVWAVSLPCYPVRSVA